MQCYMWNEQQKATIKAGEVEVDKKKWWISLKLNSNKK